METCSFTPQCIFAWESHSSVMRSQHGSDIYVSADRNNQSVRVSGQSVDSGWSARFSKHQAKALAKELLAAIDSLEK